MLRRVLLLGLFAAIALSDCGRFAAHAKATSAKSSKAPEISRSESFHPEQLSKLAVIAETTGRTRGEGRSRAASRNRMQGSAANLQTNEQRLMEDVFVQALLQRGHVVIARSDLGSVLKEQELEHSGLTQENATEMGKVLNVPAVLVVKITDYSSENNSIRGGSRGGASRARVGRVGVGARLISVETGEIWWQGNHTASQAISGSGELPLLLVKVAEKLALAFPARSTHPASPFDPTSLQKIAVVSVGETRRRKANEDHQRLVEDDLGIILGKKGYALVSRSDLDALLQEKRFQESGLTEENAAEFGKLLNVPAVLVVRISQDDTENVFGRGAAGRGVLAVAGVGARLVSVESGQVLWCRTWIEEQKVSNKLDASEVLSKVTKRIGAAFPSRSVKKVSSEDHAR